MSKRDKEKALARGETPPEIDVHDFRAAGYLPEALVNFIALLGWNPGTDQERFTLDELVQAFSIERIGKTNARFDREKLIAFNTDWAAQLPPDRLLQALTDYIAVNDSPMRQADDTQLQRILDACRGFRTFRDVETKVAFLFVGDDSLEYDLKAVKKVLAKNDGAGYAMLERLRPRLETLDPWSADSLEALIRTVCEEENAGMGQVAQPLRVAVAGTTISPAIGTTLELLGRDRSLKRIRHCLALAERM